MMVGPHFSAGRAMLAPVHYDYQVPSSPSSLKMRHLSVRLSDQPVLFWSDWGKSSSKGFLSGFCTSLAKPAA